MLTVDYTLHELQVALRFQIELEEAVQAYIAAGWDVSSTEEENSKHNEAVAKLNQQKSKVYRLRKLLEGCVR